MRSPRPPSATWGSNKSSANVSREEVSQSGAKERQRQGSIQGCRPTSAEPRGSQAKPQPRRAVEGGADPRCQVVGINHGDWRRGSRSGRSEGGACEGKGTRLSCVLCKTGFAHTEAFLDRSRKKMEGGIERRSFQIQEVMAELTIKIQDGTSRLEGLKAEARVQPSPFTVPTDPQEEIRSLRARIAQMEGSMEGDVQEAKRVKICATTLSGCDAGLPKWTSIEGGFRLKVRRRHLALDAGPAGRHARRQHWQGMVTRWQGCAHDGRAATSWSRVSVTPSMVSNAVR